MSGAPSDTGSHAGVAEFLLQSVGKAPVVVDYGCGFAHLSFEIAKQDPEAKVHLIDIECLPLAFARFRFEKHGLKAEPIVVTAEALYPRLPAHDVCIASEVMEHVYRPLEVYDHIVESLRPGGTLHGGFEDHRPGILHVSPVLAALRERVQRDFERVGVRTYLRLNSR
jgi:SAM-dependent methyltransferase